jgi:hypothetical protein
MRHLRPFAALLVIAALTMACSSASPGASTGGDASQPAGASVPEASTGGGGGGGGGGGANGSITYEITGGHDASGELPFLAGGISTWVESANGWVANFGNLSGEGAVIILNTQEGQTVGQGLTYGDGTVTISVVSDPGTDMDCTFTLDKNDADGLKGHVECTNAIVFNNTTGAQSRANFSAAWDAHN